MRELTEITSYIKEHVEADDWQLHVQTYTTHLTRFAQNAITQHMGGYGVYVELTTWFGSQRGSASINQTDPEALAWLLKTAQDTARISPEDPEFMPTSGLVELPVVNNFCQKTADLSPAYMVAQVDKAVKLAQRHKANVSGVVSLETTHYGMTTAHGFYGKADGTEFGFSATLAGEGRETKVDAGAKSVDLVNVDNLLVKLESQYLALNNPQPVQPGKWTVLLRPAAVRELFSYVVWMMDKRQADEGLSPYSGQLGQPFMGDKFNLRSDYADNELLTDCYDQSGFPGRSTVFVKDGVIKTMRCGKWWAQKTGSEEAFNGNTVIDGEEHSEEELLQMVGEGLVVNNFWYLRFVDTKSGEITGMTRDGVLHFANGKTDYSVLNMRFNEIPYDLTRRIIALGRTQLVDASSKMPAMLIKDFNFVDVTRF